MSEEQEVKWYIKEIKHSRDYSVRPILIKSAKRKGTCMIETLFKTREDREWFYKQFIQFLRELSNIVNINKSIVASNSYVCVYVSQQLLYYVLEYYKFKQVGYVYSIFSKTDTEYQDADLAWMKENSTLEGL